MRVVLRLAAHQLRAGWAGWAVLVLLIAVAGGAVLTAAAGARRTASAYPRFQPAHARPTCWSPRPPAVPGGRGGQPAGDPGQADAWQGW